MPPDEAIGLLAGGGLLPKYVVNACRDEAKRVFVIIFDGQGDPKDFEDFPHAVVRLGAAGKSIKLLRENGCRQLIMAGSIERPSVAELRPDWWGMKFFAKSGAAALGDDGLLTALIGALEEEGFDVVGAEQLLPSLLIGEGLQTDQPLTGQETDIAFALHAAKDLGARDLGQAVVVRDGNVIAEETALGTDAMLESLIAAGNAGGIMAKALKPQQERRADIPAIGPETVVNASRAGLHGIVCEAGATFLLDKTATIAVANRENIFILGARFEGPMV